MVCINEGEKCLSILFRSELNGVTVQKGVISVGSQVAVHYRTQDNRNLATSVQLRKSFSEIGAEPAQH
jgi:hypothetical protein